MNDHADEGSSAPQLSRMRTFLFGTLAFVWFAEMVQWGFLASSGGWQNVWKDFPPEAPQLATVLFITHAIRAAAKGALGVMAVFGLRSKKPAARTALDFIFPSLSGLLHTYEAGLSSMISSNLSSGTHLLALAIAFWIATVYCRRYPTLRQAMTVASTVHAGLICLLPLRRIILEIGGSSATSSILVAFAPLLVGWVLYVAFSSKVELKKQQEAYI